MGDDQIVGQAGDCVVHVTPTDTDYVQITAEYDGETGGTTSIPKNRWVRRDGISEYATNISGQIGADYDTILEALKDARMRALASWNWKTFTQTGSATAPSLEHLESLTVPDEHTDNYPTTEELRESLRESVENAMQKCLYYAFASPTGIGKSFLMATTEWLTMPEVTGGRQVVHLSPTGKSRKNAVGYSEENGRSHYVLLGRDEICPVCGGEHDPDGDGATITVDKEPVSEWIDRMCNKRGLPLHYVEDILPDVADQDIDESPCHGETGKCPASEQWEEIKDSIRNDPDYDVIHATHQFAFVSTLRHNNNVAFDEQPSFAEIGPGDVSGGLGDSDGLDTNRVKAAVNAFIDDADTDVETVDELMTIASKETGDMGHYELAEKFEDIYSLFNHRPDREWYCNHPDAHMEARAFTELLWDAARSPSDANGRRHAGLIFDTPSLSKTPNDDDIVDTHRVSLIIDDDNRITTLRIAPNMSDARSVIGFDAHPNDELWRVNVGDAMDSETLMSEDERRLWRRYERRLLVIQVDDGAYSYTTDKRFDVEKNKVLIETLREQYGDQFRTAVAPAAVEDHIKNAFVDSGIDDPQTMHQGHVQSRNEFQGQCVGAEIGCIDPGDDFVLDVLAEVGKDATAERQDKTCDTCSGSGCDQCNQTGYKRAFGRGFVGEDSDTAASILASVRENEVAQSIGRYARKADDPDDWAVVFVRTTAVPDNMVDFKGPRVWKYEEKQRAIVDYLRENTTGTAKTIAEWITEESDDVESCTKRHVNNTIGRLVEDGSVAKHVGQGYQGATIYEWTASNSVSRYGELKFEIIEVDHSEDQMEAAIPEEGVECLNLD